MSASYIAFKNLIVGPAGELQSPIYRSVWAPAVTPWGVLPALRVPRSELGAWHGIFAASYDEAQNYPGRTFAVVPCPFDDDEMSLAQDGWRATGAAVLCPVAGPEEAARLVLEAHRMGYPQVEGILKWAARQKEAADFLEQVIALGDAKTLFEAGLKWPDDRYSPVIADALADTGNLHYIFQAGKRWKRERFSFRFAEALLEAPDFICKAGQYWKGDRFPIWLAERLVWYRIPKLLYEAGLRWPDDHYIPEIADALVESHSAEYLFLAGMFWPAHRYSEKIAAALAATGSKWYARNVEGFWPDERQEHFRQFLKEGAL